MSSNETPSSTNDGTPFDVDNHGLGNTGGDRTEPPSKRARIDEDNMVEEEDEASTGDAPSTPARKSSTPTTASAAVDPELLEHAKSRLSKWAARLFDPDRPRGLVQAPETIPLNDEYLKAFGERVKKEQANTKVNTNTDADIDNDDNNDEDEDLYDDLPNAATASLLNSKDKSSSNSSHNNTDGVKVKITNMAYTTDAVLLQAACEKYGPLMEVNLIMDDNHPERNAGRAYVTFQLLDDAQDCIDNLTELGGRSLRVSLAASKPKSTTTSTHPGGGGGGGNLASQSLLNRFSEKDISTICFRCGKVGHYESDCKNPAKAKACSLCGSLEHLERGCDHRIFCFNCGCPGHSVRDCTQRRGLPRRLVCGICFESGHHRNSCRNYRGSGPQAIRDAICMECGQRGHFLCRELKWFFGLKGMFCFNCGSQGHSGFQCHRPNFFQCRDEPSIGNTEIERAEAESVSEQLQRQEIQQSRQRQIGRYKSMPQQPARQQRPGGGNGGVETALSSQRKTQGSGNSKKRGY